MSPTPTGFYVTGGTLRHDAPSYVARRADRELYEGLTRGEFCYVLTSRQMGKSSLMARTAARLRQEGVAVVVLDLTRVGQNLTPEQWFDGLLARLGEDLNLEDELDEFWLGHPRLGPLQRWLAALEQVVLARVPGRIVLFIDEIDTVQSLSFSTDEFFAGIRECYNRRTEDPEFERLTFCLLGVASPSDLIRDTRMTPFNIGRRIELSDFTEADALPLAAGLVGGTDFTTETRRHGGKPGVEAEITLRRVLYWTGGHPYLTQRLCHAVADALSAPSTKHQAPSTQTVDELCADMFLSPRAREQDHNLLFVREHMLRSEADRASLLDLYAQVWRRKRVPDDETNPLVSLLKLSGITRAEAGHLRLRNRIYARVFDRGWVVQHMPDAELRRQRRAYHRGLLRAAAVSGVMLATVGSLALVAVDQAHRADRTARREAQQRQATEEGRQKLRRTLYAADVNLAQQAWNAANLGVAKALLEAQRPTHGEEDLRGFEWRYLWRLCQDHSLATLRGHTAAARAVAFSPDGRVLASASWDRTVRLWDVARRRVLAILPHRANVWRLSFSPNGRTLATGTQSYPGSLTLWNVAVPQRPRRILTCQPHPSSIWGVSFSPDGRLLTTAGAANDGRILLWETATWRMITVLRTAASGFSELVFSPDSTILAAAPDDHSVMLWHVARKQQMATLRGHTADVWALAFSPDGRTLASGSQDSTVRLWDVPTRRSVAVLRGHTVTVEDVAFSPNGGQLASASSDNTVRLWDVAARREIATLMGHSAVVSGVAFSPDGKTLATGSADHTVKLWDTTVRQERDVARPPDANLGSMAVSPDDRLLAVGDRRGDIQFWSVPRSGSGGPKPVSVIPHGHTGGVSSLSFSPDGQLLASGGGDGLVKLWNVAGDTGGRYHPKAGRGHREITTLRGHRHIVGPITFSPDGKLLASESALEDTIRVWDVARGREAFTVRADRNAVNVDAVAFSPDGKTLATGDDNWLIRLWDVATRQLKRTLRGHDREVGTLSFSHDGRILASGSGDRTVRLWDVATGRERAILRGHRVIVSSLAFSPDDRTLASGSWDRTIKLWNPATGRELATLEGQQNTVSSVAFSRDGNLLVSASEDGTVRLWRAATFAETDTSAGSRRHAASR